MFGFGRESPDKPREYFVESVQQFLLQYFNSHIIIRQHIHTDNAGKDDSVFPDFTHCLPILLYFIFGPPLLWAEYY